MEVGISIKDLTKVYRVSWGVSGLVEAEWRQNGNSLNK